MVWHGVEEVNWQSWCCDLKLAWIKLGWTRIEIMS